MCVAKTQNILTKLDLILDDDDTEAMLCIF